MNKRKNYEQRKYFHFDVQLFEEIYKLKSYLNKEEYTNVIVDFSRKIW